MGFMEPQSGTKVDDYYILFRDADAPAPTSDIYKKRCEQQDLLIADKASYVWGYVGKLNDSQACVLQTRLDGEFEERLIEKFGGSDADSPADYGLEIATRKPGVLSFLAEVSSDLTFLSNVSPNHRFWFFPEGDELLQIKEVLSIRAKNDLDLILKLHRLTFPKTHKSFVQLLPLKTLVDGWRRIDCYRNMDLLRHTAAIWFIGASSGKFDLTLEKNHNPISPDIAETVFKSVVIDDEYIQLLLPHQLGVLAKCINIANRIRMWDDGENNIENQYHAIGKYDEVVSTRLSEAGCKEGK